MKKIFKRLVFVTLSSIAICSFNSCKKGDFDSSSSTTENSIITVVKNVAAPNGVLKFNSKEELGQLLVDIKNNKKLGDELAPQNFKTLYRKNLDFKSKYPNIEKIDLNTATESTQEQMMKDLFEYDLDNYCANLEETHFILNEDLQVIIGNKLYQLTRIGSLEVDLDKLNELITLLQSNKEDLLHNKDFEHFNGEALIGGDDTYDTYLVLPGIERRQLKSTFLTQDNNFLDEGGSDQGSGTVENINNGDPVTEGSLLNSPGEQMQTFTVGGNFNRAISGEADGRRFTFETYKTNWLGFYRSIGIQGKFQRRNCFWFACWWGNSWADELVVGADNFQLNTSYVFPHPQQFNTLARPTFKGIGQQILGNHSWDIVDIDINLKAQVFGQTYSLNNNSINTLLSGQLNSFINNQFDDKFAKVVDDVVNSFDPWFKNRHENQAMRISALENQNRLNFSSGFTFKHQGYSRINEWWFDKNAGFALVYKDGKLSIGPNTYEYELKSGSFFGKAKLGSRTWKYRIVKI